MRSFMSPREAVRQLDAVRESVPISYSWGLCHFPSFDYGWHVLFHDYLTSGMYCNAFDFFSSLMSKNGSLLGFCFHLFFIQKKLPTSPYDKGTFSYF